MAKKSAAFEQEPAVRKSFLVIGGVAVAAMLVGFILMTFVFGGGDGGNEATAPTPAAQTDSGGTVGGTSGGSAAAPESTPVPSEPAGLNGGGRNPFRARGT